MTIIYHHHRLKGPGKPTAPNKYTLGRTIPKKMKFSKRKAALSDPLAKTLSWPFFNAIFAFSSTTLHVCTSATGNASGLHHAHWGRQQSHTRKHAKRMALENRRGISNALRHPKGDSNDSHKTWNCCGRRHSVSHSISSHARLYRPAQCGNRASHHRTLVSRYRSCAWYSSIAWYLCKVAAASPTVGKAQIRSAFHLHKFKCAKTHQLLYKTKTKQLDWRQNQKKGDLERSDHRLEVTWSD